jgi:hypothetical protein
VNSNSNSKNKNKKTNNSKNKDKKKKKNNNNNNALLKGALNLGKLENLDSAPQRPCFWRRGSIG